MPPVQSVTSVSYVDQDGILQTLAPAVYQLLNIGDDTKPGALVLAPEQSWPATRRQGEAVRVVYTSGYVDHNAVPEGIRQAVMLRAATWFDNRQDLVTDARELGAVEALLFAHRVLEL